MQPWLKLWPERLFTPEFFMLSERARSTLAFAIMAEHRCCEAGVPMLLNDLCIFTGITRQKQDLAVKELAARGLIAVDGDAVSVPVYHEMMRPRSSAERMRLLRERDAGSARSRTPYAKRWLTLDGRPKTSSQVSHRFRGPGN